MIFIFLSVWIIKSQRKVGLFCFCYLFWMILIPFFSQSSIPKYLQFLLSFIITLSRVFSRLRKLMVFHWSLSDSKSPQVFRTLLSILADFNNAVLRVVSILPPISNSSSPPSKPLGTVPSAPITKGITVTLMFHNFLCPLARSKYLSLFSLSFFLFFFTPWFFRTAKSTKRQILFFFFFFC